MTTDRVSELSWDSAFFGKKIGELHLDSVKPGNINDSLEQARRDQYRYLLCKVESHNTHLTKMIEAKGFYLTDVAITWFVETLDFTQIDLSTSVLSEKPRLALRRDIAAARELVKSLFLHSRFYNDPFFNKKEADNLFQSWIENSINGEAADATFLIDDVGVITCRRLGERKGEIILVGVREEKRGQKLGKGLIMTAFNWFNSNGISRVNVKTQLRNVSAMNFYSKLGFSIGGYSLVFGKIL